MTINPNNIPGATMTLVGWAAGDPEYPLYDKEGSGGYKQVSVDNREGYKKNGEFVEKVPLGTLSRSSRRIGLASGFTRATRSGWITLSRRFDL